MSLSYRTRRKLRQLRTAITVILCLTLTAVIGWMIWVDRYIIYTQEGAKLDFELPQTFPQGTLAVAPEQTDFVKIILHEASENNSQAVIEQVPIHGYYINTKTVTNDIPGLIGKLQTLPACTAVMMDMTTIKGSFYYNTAIGQTVDKNIDQEQMNRLLKLLSDQDIHSIARIPAFRDWEYGLNNVPQGLPKKGGNGSLWMDDKNCYWLDPTKDEVLSYLISIVNELKGLGFDEVVFTDFRFPDTEKIKFSGDKSAAIANAASTLVEACSNDSFFVSFQSTDYAFPLPNGNTRLYLQNVPASDISLVRQQIVAKNPSIQLLFLTEANDTRYNDYCVLRPLENMMLTEEDPS